MNSREHSVCFVTGSGQDLAVSADVNPPAGLTKQILETVKVALRELGVEEDLASMTVIDAGTDKR